MSAVAGRGMEVTFGDTVALAASDFTIPAGATAALVGPNGSGKSTLLNAIAGLVEPSAGTIEVLGRIPSRARPGVSYVLQSTRVNESLPVTVAEVVAMGRYATAGLFGRLSQADRDAVAAALSALRIDDIAGKHLLELSGGQRQRVLVAQGLVQDHDLLLLDEPYTGLDVVSEGLIRRVVDREHAEGKTVMMSTHDLYEAESADYVILLANRVVACGKPGDVLTPEYLGEAYGTRFLQLEDGRFFIDDPAHLPVDQRHVHLERTVHLEAPGSDLHQGE